MALYLAGAAPSNSEWTVSVVGGKAFALRELMRAGVRVPSGVAISISLLRECLQTPSLLDAKITISGLVDVSSVVAACRQYRSQAESRPVPDKLRSEIDLAVGRLRGVRFAVRSSAVQEDGLHSSWAGQFDSFLDVPADRVGAMVVACWASLVSPRSVFYGRAVGVELRSLEMSVLVQEFLPASASGVAFTRHPLSKDESVVYIEAVPGVGEKLVSGSAIPDRYIVRKHDSRVLSTTTSNRVAGQGRRHRKNESPDVSGVIRPSQPVLNQRNIEEIVEICRIAEDRFGISQDVEFGVWRGRVYALQSRPITD